MKSRTAVTLSTVGIAVIALLFAAGHIVESQQALAYLDGGWGGG